MPSSQTAAAAGRRSLAGFTLRVLLFILTPLAVAVFLAAQIGDIDPAPFPRGLDSPESLVAEEEHPAVLGGASERLGDGLLPGPEDLVYDEKEGFLYTGCRDGWIRRFRPTAAPLDVVVEDWFHVGGRPLGVARSPDGTIVVAEAYQGMLRLNKDGSVSLLADEAEGVKFKLTDGVDISSDGLIYFTDASHKYHLDAYPLDILEGRPNGRLVSFDSSNNQTTVLARDLYFPNGVSLSPDQWSLIFCETPLRRCRRYHIQGEKKGQIENFVDNLPGYPDNIHYDGDGHYSIAISGRRSKFWDLVMKHPLLRKYLIVIVKLVGLPPLSRAGVLSVSLEGRPKALYSDRDLSHISSGLKVGRHLYMGSLTEGHVLRLDLSKFPLDA
ncbi:hypothetical protein KSP39_PZI007757 [Platanthera zijinensis]|uniref:Strictosidine synthase conserved region domain-containing protein n=1 Tax=Platanthera zijinensis TaxID=2320716 RepID=A0AAP0BPH9_9ASPA